MNLIYFPNEIPNRSSYSNLFFPSEKRTGNTLYQELSFQDSEALGDVDEGADITGEQNKLTKLVFLTGTVSLRFNKNTTAYLA